MSVPTGGGDPVPEGGGDPNTQAVPFANQSLAGLKEVFGSPGQSLIELGTPNSGNPALGNRSLPMQGLKLAMQRRAY